MKYNRLTKIFGVLFSVSLTILAYFSIVVGIALAFDGNSWFGVMIYVFAAFAVVNIVGLFFVKKKPMVTMIISSTISVVVLATTIYLVAVGLISESPVAFVFYASAFVLGALTSTFAFLDKKNNNQVNGWF